MTSPAPVSATTTAVHVVMDRFNALWEGAVNWSACGPVANEVAVAALDNRLPDPGNALKVCARDAAAGRFKQPGGQTLADIAWDLGERGFAQLTVVPYSDSPNLDALHQLVKLGGLNKWPVILQVSRAYNLPDNEAGVQYHFVVSGGIDSARGYLIANGDTRTGIALHPTFPANTHIPLNWASWSVLESAGVCGAILVHPRDWEPPSPPPATEPMVTIPLSQVQAWEAEITQVQSQAAALQAALKALS